RSLQRRLNSGAASNEFLSFPVSLSPKMRALAEEATTDRQVGRARSSAQNCNDQVPAVQLNVPNPDSTPADNPRGLTPFSSQIELLNNCSTLRTEKKLW